MRNHFPPIQPGDHFHRLTIISRSERVRPSWNCVCKCGGETVVTDYSLKCGKREIVRVFAAGVDGKDREE